MRLYDLDNMLSARNAFRLNSYGLSFLGDNTEGPCPDTNDLVVLPPKNNVVFKTGLSFQSYEIIRTAWYIGIPPAVLAAFRVVESAGKPFAVRFEPHRFNKHSTHKMPYTAALNSDGTKKSFSLTPCQTNEEALRIALGLDPKAAYEATSWGLFQVMGDWHLSEFASVDAAVKQFYTDPLGFSFKTVQGWFKKNPRAVTAANNKDWAGLAKRYNGSNYAENKYDEKLKFYYDKASALDVYKNAQAPIPDWAQSIERPDHPR